MPLRAVECKFNVASTMISTYDPNKINVGTLTYKNSGVPEADNWVGPNPISVAHPMEMTTSISSMMPHVIQFKPDLHYVFLADNATAAATRRINMFTYIPSTSQYSWVGFITLTYSNTTVHTVRGFRMDRLMYSTGTVTVAATAVTGTSTFWSSVGRMSVGSRIGFGTTDPKLVTNWYNVSAIASDTGLTLSTTAGTIAAGTPYVLEEYRAITGNTNATAGNGGVYLTKGLHPGIFVPAGTTITAAASADSIRGVYWLADAATVLNTTAGGCAIDDPIDNSTRYIYVSNGASTTAQFFKYNVRVALAGLATSKSVSAFVLATGTQAVTGNMTQVNNGRVGTLQHGPASGQLSLFWSTTSRIYRALLSNITSGSVSFITDNMVEMPKGGTNTYPATAGFSQVDISDSIDKLIIMTNTTGRHYITQYRTDGGQFDYNFGADTRQTDIGAADAGSQPHFSQASIALSIWSEAGALHVCKNGTTAATNQIYVLPIGANWDFAFANNNIVISQKIETPNISRLKSVYVAHADYIGSDALGITPEPYKVYVRTSGIDDNSGGWTLVDPYGNINGVTGGTHIQFAFTFRTIGYLCVGTRVYGCTLLYEDTGMLDNYRADASRSDAVNKRFAFRFATAFGSIVPTLRIRIYNDITNGLLVEDTTVGSSGTWEKTTDGTNWVGYNTTDKGNDTTYIRYTPASMASGVLARAVITRV